MNSHSVIYTWLFLFHSYLYQLFPSHPIIESFWSQSHLTQNEIQNSSQSHEILHDPVPRWEHTALPLTLPLLPSWPSTPATASRMPPQVCPGFVLYLECSAGRYLCAWCQCFYSNSSEIFQQWNFLTTHRHFLLLPCPTFFFCPSNAYCCLTWNQIFNTSLLSVSPH